MTKKELFTKAHQMTKEIKAVYTNVDYKFQLGLCLTYLQDKEVEVVELKGTEKQVIWAESLKKDFLDMVVGAKENVLKSKNSVRVFYVELQKEVETITDAKKISEIRKALDIIITKAIFNIENETSAKKIIDIHQGLKTYGASIEDLIKKFI